MEVVVNGAVAEEVEVEVEVGVVNGVVAEEEEGEVEVGVTGVVAEGEVGAGVTGVVGEGEVGVGVNGVVAEGEEGEVGVGVNGVVGEQGGGEGEVGVDVVVAEQEEGKGEVGVNVVVGAHKQALEVLAAEDVQGLTMDVLGRLTWADEECAFKSLMVMKRLKMCDEYGEIADEIDAMLGEEDQLEIIKTIPPMTLVTTRFERQRDNIVRKYHTPKEIMEKTGPFKEYKEELKFSRDFHLKLAGEFKEMALEGFLDGVLIKDKEDFQRMEAEAKAMIPEDPPRPRLVILAIAGNGNIIRQALIEGYEVFLYLEL